jgi:hypothetical protein
MRSANILFPEIFILKTRRTRLLRALNLRQRFKKISARQDPENNCRQSWKLKRYSDIVFRLAAVIAAGL